MNTSRREFLAGSAVAGLFGAAALAGCSAPAPAPAEPTDTTPEPITPAHNPISEETFDIVVVGSGTAGTVAATRAAELGAKVICIEKRSGLMGTSAVAEGFAAVNSKAQLALDITMNPTNVVADIMKYHHCACNGPVVAKMIRNSGEAIDWLSDHGITFGRITGLGNSYPTWHIPNNAEGKMTQVKYVLEVLTEAAQKNGVEFRTNTPMTDLIVEDGKVAGVYAKTDAGEIKLTATKGVVLATGGYASNPEMFQQLTNTAYEKVTVWGFDGRDGDGIRVATEQAGAITHHPDAVMWTCGAFPNTTAFNDFPNFIMAMQPSLHVNENAQRYFDEGQTIDMTCCGNSTNTQAANFVVIDSDYIDHIETVGPWKGMPNLGAFAGQPYPCRDGIDSASGLVKANSIEEMAEKLGLDPAALKATVDRYNTFCDNSVDEDFGKAASQLLPVRTAPFYGGKLSPALFTTVGGLKVNTDMQAVKATGEAIPGLYAVGGDANGMYGSNYDVDVTSGGQQGWCLASGKMCAESIMA